MTQRLRVAIVDEEFPFPANSGKRIRTMNLVERLAKQHDIFYVAHRNADAAELSEAVSHFESIGVKTIVVPAHITPKKGIKFFAKLFANLFSRLPYSVSSHTSQAMKDRIQKLHRDEDIQIWHCEWTPYAELFRDFDANPLVIAAHNVESLIWKRYVETESNFLKRWYIRIQWKKFEKFERWAFGRATRTIAVSQADAELAMNDFGATHVDVVQNGVDIRTYQVGDAPRSPKEMIFLGSLDWRPNLDGIQQFLHTAFPKIVAAEPTAKLTIVGRNAPTWLKELAESDPHIDLHSNVPEVIPFLSRAGIMVVPLRIGGGSRLKILEAAANGLPVVSTRVGAEGLKFCPGKEYLQVDDIEQMAEPVLQAMREPELCQALTTRARNTAESEYDWDILAKTQSKIWCSIE